MLPLAFCERMRRMLGQAEYEAFLKSYDENKYQGLRFNIGKGKQEDFLALAEDAFSLEKIRGQSMDFIMVRRLHRQACLP